MSIFNNKNKKKLKKEIIEIDARINELDHFGDYIIPKAPEPPFIPIEQNGVILPINQQILTYQEISRGLRESGFDFNKYPRKDYLVNLERCKECKACLYTRPSYPDEGICYYMCGLKHDFINEIAICKYTGEFYDKFFHDETITYARDFKESEFIEDLIKYHMDSKFGTRLSSVNEDNNPHMNKITILFSNYTYMEDWSEKRLKVYLDHTLFEGTNIPLKPEFHDLLTLNNKIPIATTSICDTTIGAASFELNDNLFNIIAPCLPNLMLKFVPSHLESPNHGIYYDDALFLFLNGRKTI